MQSSVSANVADVELNIPQNVINEFQARALPGIIFRLTSQIRALIDATLIVQAAYSDQLQVLVTADELLNIPRPRADRHDEDPYEGAGQDVDGVRDRRWRAARTVGSQLSRFRYLVTQRA